MLFRGIRLPPTGALSQWVGTRGGPHHPLDLSLQTENFAMLRWSRVCSSLEPRGSALSNSSAAATCPGDASARVSRMACADLPAKVPDSALRLHSPPPRLLQQSPRPARAKRYRATRVRVRARPPPPEYMTEGSSRPMRDWDAVLSRRPWRARRAQPPDTSLKYSGTDRPSLPRLDGCRSATMRGRAR